MLRETESLCPKCLQKIKAEIYADKGKVWIKKTCPEHGSFNDVYWGDYEMYKRAEKFAKEGKGIERANSDKQHIDCPKDCGLCSEHKSHTGLANIVLTNRCDLSCWYCFFYAEKAGYIYEPTIEQIREMARNLRAEKPIPCNAVQLTGGEPCMRDNLIEIIQTLKEEGFDHVQLNTNGIRLSQDPVLTQAVRDAGVNTIYLSFDGVTAQTNPKNNREIPKVMENCRNANLGIVLVPTIINTVNDHEIGDIIRFGFENIDIVRAVNYQPVSLVGKMPKAEREKYRITIPAVIERIEQQTNAEIAKEDFYPVPTVVPVSQFIGALIGKPQYELSTHFTCGMATYLFKDGNRMLPITRFLDVPGFIEYLNEKTDDLQNGKSRYLVGAKTLFRFNSFIDKKHLPHDLKLGKILHNVIVKHDYRALGVFHHRSLFVGMMHFMDLYNYDIERVKRCCVHYATPSKEMPIIPFCAFNVIPQWYRDKVQKEFGVSVEEWERSTGRKLSDDYYRREAKAVAQ